MQGFMQAMVVVHDEVGEVREQGLRDFACKFERDHIIPRPVDNSGGDRNRLKVEM